MPSVDLATLVEQLHLLRILCGVVMVADIVAGDGEHTATFRLTGSKANAEVELTIEPKRGKLTSVNIHRLSTSVTRPIRIDLHRL
jgi:hypothetical protein